MSRWVFEPGHTAAEFCVRHMMVTSVRGAFKDVHGTLVFDPADPGSAVVEATIDASKLWTGEAARDAHLMSADFLDVENFPTIELRSRRVELLGPVNFKLHGDITIRGVTGPITFDVQFLGAWQTPWWEGGVDLGPKTRAGFLANGRLNRQDFGVSWNGVLDHGGVIVGDEIEITLDAEAIEEK